MPARTSVVRLVHPMVSLLKGIGWILIPFLIHSAPYSLLTPVFPQSPQGHHVTMGWGELALEMMSTVVIYVI